MEYLKSGGGGGATKKHDVGLRKIEKNNLKDVGPKTKRGIVFCSILKDGVEVGCL